MFDMTGIELIRWYVMNWLFIVWKSHVSNLFCLHQCRNNVWSDYRISMREFIIWMCDQLSLSTKSAPCLGTNRNVNMSGLGSTGAISIGRKTLLRCKIW